jgi:hypothetical protein
MHEKLENVIWTTIEWGVLRPVFWVDDHVPLPPAGRVILMLPVVPVFVGGLIYVILRDTPTSRVTG